MSDPPQVFLFLGPEEGLKSDEIAAIRQKLKKATGETPDEHKFYLPMDEVTSAVEILRNGSLFASHRLVIISGIEVLKKKADVATLVDYLSSPNSDSTLVLVSESVRIDKRIDGAVPGSHRKVFWEMFENQKHGWVQSYFRKKHVAVSPEAVDLFLEIVENNTQELRAEADKLCTFVGPEGEVGVEEVETFIYHSREESVFTLFRHIAGDSFESALTAMEKLVSSGESGPIQIVGGLVFQIRRLLSLRLLLDNDVPMDTAFSRLNIRGKRIQAEYRTGAGKYQVKELERAIHLLTEYDALFRAQRPGIHKCLLELMVYQLMFQSQRLVRPLGFDDRPIAEDAEDLVLVR